MDTPNWSHRIDHAQTPDQVLSLVREYFDSRDPKELAFLPPECFPPTYTALSIADCAYRLAAQHDHGKYGRIAQKYSLVLSRASVRLAELAHGRAP